MQEDQPIASGVSEFLKTFGNTVAQGSTNEQKAALKAYLADKAEKGKDTRQDKALDFKDKHPTGSKGAQDTKDKEFLSTFKGYQSAWKGALQNFINEHRDMNKNPQGAMAWNAMSKEDKNKEISDAINDPNGELSALKLQHDFVYNPDNMAHFSQLVAHFSQLNGKSTPAPTAKPATALDLQAPPIVPPPAQQHSALPPQSMPAPAPQNRPMPQVAQAPMAQPKPQVPPPVQMAQAPQFKMPSVGGYPVGPQSAPTGIPGQGPSGSQDEEGLDESANV